MDKEYFELLERKKKRAVESGFEIDESVLNPVLFPFQKWGVKRALKAGKYAFFWNCGLGKTISQLEWLQQVANHTNKSVLIVCPLAVLEQTIREGVKFGYAVKEYDGDLSSNGIYITNYDQLEKCGLHPVYRCCP